MDLPHTDPPPLSKDPRLTLGLSRSWYMLQIYRGDYNHIMQRLHNSYGPPVRITPDEVSISGLAAISEIYDVRGTYAKTDLYDMWEGNISKYRLVLPVR